MTAGNKTILDTIGSNTLTIGAGGTTVVIAGNLTVSGTTTTVNTGTLNIADSLYVLNSDEDGTPSQDSGFIVERGTSTNVGLFWDESADEFVFVNTSEDGTTAGNVTIASYANLQIAKTTGTSLVLDGNKSVTPGDGGVVHIDTHTITDSATSGSGTATKYTHVAIEAPTLAATNSSVTTSDVATFYISGAATAGSNQTLTRNYAMWVDAGNVRFDGSIYTGTIHAMNSSGLLQVTNQSNIAGVGTITSGTWQGTAIDGDYINDNIVSGQAEITSGLAAADELLYSDGGTVKKVGLDNFVALAPALVDEDAVADGDYLLFLDGGASGNMNKEAVHDLATLFAGTGLTATSSVINIDAAQSGITSLGTLTGLTLDGDKSVTPGDGAMIHLDTSTITDSATSGSGTATKYTHVTFEAPTLAATNSSVTTTDAATVYINGAITAGTNQTLTRNYALWVDAGNVRFDGSIYSGTTHVLSSSGLVQVAAQTGITSTGTLTTLDVSSSADIDIVSTVDEAGAIYLHANGGTSETIKIHSDQGTSVTEGAESVTILSDAGGVGIRSTANLANAVNITVDGGTSSTMTMFNDQGTSSTEGAASIQLLSDVGGVGIKSGLNAANAILLTADGGTSETIKIHSDQGTGSASIDIHSDAGGVQIQGMNGVNYIKLTADNDFHMGTTSGQMLISSTYNTGAIVFRTNTTAHTLMQTGVISRIATAHDAAGNNFTINGGATTAGTTNNIAGGDLILQGGQGKGSGAGGDIIFKTANAGGSGSSLNALATALTISDDLSSTFVGAVTANAGVTVDNITIDGTEIDLSSGDLTVDVAGDIVLSAAGGQVTVDDGSTTVLTFDAAEPSLTISDDADTGDNFKISVGAAGITTIATTDDDAGLAHMTIRPDGYLIVQQDSVTIDSTLDNNSLVVKDFDTVTNSAIALSSKGTGTKPSIFFGTGNNTHHMMLSTGARMQASVWTGGGIAPDANNATIMESIATTAAIYRHWYGGHYFYGEGYDAATAENNLTAHDGGDPNEFAPTLLATISPTNGSTGSITGALGILGGIFVGVADLGDYDTFTGDLTKLVDDASNGSGAATLYIGNTSITTSSDRRIKKDIVDTSVNALDTLDKLRVVDFTWDDPTDIAPNNRNMRGQWTGMIAQEAVDVVPYIINAPRTEDGVIDYDDETTWTVDYQHLVPMLVKAIQELKQEIAELKGGN